MDDSDEDASNPTTELDLKTREQILDNEMRSFHNRGFHDGYDEGKKIVLQKAFDAGYQKAFEQNFVLSTLKGVAHALKSSYNLSRSSSTTSTSPLMPSINRRRSNLFGSSKNDDTSSSSSSSSNISNTTGSSNNNVNNILSNHLSMLESMKFDNASDIESIKNDLIKICRENRLEILAHYVSQIG